MPEYDAQGLCPVRAADFDILQPAHDQNLSTHQARIQTAGLPGTLYEFKQAARALREFTDFLDRHPEALLQGRSNRR